MKTKFIQGILYQVLKNTFDEHDDCELCCFDPGECPNACELDDGIYFKEIPIVEINNTLYYRIKDYDDFACMRCDIKKCNRGICTSEIYKIVEF